MIRQLTAIGLPALIVAASLSLVSNSSDAATLSPAANAAFADVSRCLTSGKDKKLDVYYLIDSSGSLVWTDPENQRQGILESSMAQLGGFTAEGIETSVAVSFFATDVEKTLDWTPIEGPEDAQDISKKVSNLISNDRAGGRTDWEEGLRVAYRDLTSRGDSCKMLVWFTDGGINPGNSDSASFDSLSRLCRPGITGGGAGRGDFGLIADFRKAEIPVFGVLYANLEATYEFWKRTDGAAIAQDIVDLESWWMSFMQPLVEGRGQVSNVSTDGFSSNGYQLECAEVNAEGIAPIGQANGAFLNAEDPVTLAYQFLKLQAQITGGSINSASLTGFNVPAGTAKFTVLLDSEEWELIGPDGSDFEISPSSTNPRASVSSSNGANAVTVSTASDESLLGQWQLQTSSSQVDLFLYSGLTLLLDRDRTSKVLSDFDNTLSGRVERTSEFTGVPIDLTSYENKTFELTYLSEGERVRVEGVTVGIQNDGEFIVEGFNPDGSQPVIQLFIELNLGSQFAPVESEFTLEIQDKNALAKLQADTLQLSNLIGPEGAATGQFLIEGPNTSASSQFCFAGIIDRLEDSQTGIEKLERADKFRFFLNGQALGADGLCFELAQDEILPVDISVQNEIQANSEVVAILGISSSAPDSGGGFEAPIRVGFTSETVSNQSVAIGAIILLLLLGLLIPMLILSLINFLTTRFLPVDGVVRAAFPVKIEPGQAARIVSAEHGAMIAIDSKDFKFVAPESSSRVYETGAGSAKAKVPFFPLSSTWYEWQAPQGTRIIGSYGSASKSTRDIRAGKAIEISPNFGENWALVLPEGELLKNQNEAISGDLIIFATSGKLADYQSKVLAITNQPAYRQKLTALQTTLIAETAKSQKETAAAQNDSTSGASAPAVPQPGVPRPPTPGSSVPRPPAPGSSIPKPPEAGNGGGVPKPPSPPKPPNQN